MLIFDTNPVPNEPTRIERVCDVAARYRPAALIIAELVVDPATTMLHADLVLITRDGCDPTVNASRLAADLNGVIAPLVRVHGMTINDFLRSVDDPESLAHRAASGKILLPTVHHPRELREVLRARRHLA